MACFFRLLIDTTYFDIVWEFNRKFTGHQEDVIKIFSRRRRLAKLSYRDFAEVKHSMNYGNIIYYMHINMPGLIDLLHT